MICSMLCRRSSVLLCLFFFFKQKTAYEMRISDWSSDVCSSDLAAVEAARARLRPILMTSFAFILGVAPLVWASGPGYELRQALGTAVFYGKIGRAHV